MDWQLIQLIIGVGFYWILDLALIGYGIYLIAKVWRWLLSYFDLGKVSKYDK